MMLESTKTSSLESIKNLNLCHPPPLKPQRILCPISPRAPTIQNFSTSQQSKIGLICRWAKNIDDVTAISALTNVKVYSFVSNAAARITRVAGHFAVPQQHHFVAPVCCLHLAQVIVFMLLGIFIHSAGVQFLLSGSYSFERTTSAIFKSCVGCQAFRTCMFFGSPKIPSPPQSTVGGPSIDNISSPSIYIFSNIQSLHRSSNRTQVPAWSSQA
jgi:hypothetical protein